MNNAAKIHRQLRAMGYGAAEQKVIRSEFELPGLLSLVRFADKQGSLALRFPVSPETPSKGWTEKHVYALVELRDYAASRGSSAHAVLSRTLGEDEAVLVLDASDALDLALTSVTASKQTVVARRSKTARDQAVHELQRWLEETEQFRS